MDVYCDPYPVIECAVCPDRSGKADTDVRAAVSFSRVRYVVSKVAWVGAYHHIVCRSTVTRMTDQTASASFEQVAQVPADSPTLIERLSGTGSSRRSPSIKLRRNSRSSTAGTLRPMSSRPSCVRRRTRPGPRSRLCRSRSGSHNPQSDLALPQPSFEPLSQCVLKDLADEFGRAIFFAGAPAGPKSNSAT